MTGKILKVGVIGCGGIAFGKHLPALHKLSAVKLVAFCDIDKSRAEQAKAEFGTKDSVVYQDYQDMLERAELDVVHVCTPNNSHAEITIAALEAGAHVMCEKPMAKTSEEAESMLAAAQRTGKKLTIGYQGRFRADSQHLHQLCRRGDLGEIYYARALAIRRRAVPTWGVFLDKEKQGGGPLIDIGTHALDLTLWLMDNYTPKYAVGTVFHKLNKRENAANAWGPWDPQKFNVEDSAFGFVVMEDGATIMLEASWALNTLLTGEARCVLAGTEGGADMEDGLRINGEEFGKLYSKTPQLEASGVDFYEGESQSPEDLEAKQWIDCILQDKDPLVLPEEALVVTKILEAIYKSAQTGQPVFFQE